MQTFEEIRTQFLSYANSISLEGVAVEKLCSLLAFSAYKNQMLQCSDTIENQFVSCTKLNSSIFHSANMLYSVPRGRCPKVLFENLRAIESKTVYYLDQALVFNGFYFYYNIDDENGLTINPSDSQALYDFNTICSTKQLQSAEEDVNDGIYSVDFMTTENVSSDFKLVLINSSGEETKVSRSLITEESSKFFYKIKKSDSVDDDSEEEEEDITDILSNDPYDYKYTFLAITIPNYGVRIIRHAESQGWGDSDTVKLRLDYLPYSETSPNITTLTAVPGFLYVNDGITNTTLTVFPYEERISDINEIYANATSAFLQQGNVATESDLYIALKTYSNENSSLANLNFSIMQDVKYVENPVEGQPPIVTNSSKYTTVFFNGGSQEQKNLIDECIENLTFSLSVASEIVPFEAHGIGFEVSGTQYNSLYVKAYPSSKELSNASLSALCVEYRKLIGQPLSHAKIEADIAKMGFEYVKLYYCIDPSDMSDPSNYSELVSDIICEPYQYPALTISVATFV